MKDAEIRMPKMCLKFQQFDFAADISVTFTWKNNNRLTSNYLNRHTF